MASEPIPVPAAGRLLILVVADNASTSLPGVLGKIPASFAGLDHRVLIVDNASQDATFEVACALSRANHRTEVLCNPVRQGHGGNQKIGYRYAIDEGFDVVVPLRGDDQDSPEAIDQLIRPLFRGEADCALGTRLATPGATRASGLPLTRRIANRLLTRLQNALLGSGLSELHSGPRAYSVAALASVPFEANTDDSHFDTEVLIQLLRRGLVLSEVAVPVFPGSSAGDGAGMAHAWRVVATTVASRLHDLGVFFQSRYEVRRDSEVYDIKLGYASSHTMAMERVPPGAKVLDLGCGQGKLARELRRAGSTVHGIDAVDRLVPEALDRFIQGDLETVQLDLEADGYDVLLLLDIIEHLSSPEDFLRRLRHGLGSTSPAIVVTVPNVAFLPVRLRLLLGGFEYGREGILDLTHRRLFTVESVSRLLHQQGYRVRRVRGVPAPFPKAVGSGWLGSLLVAVNRLLISLSPGLFAYQILLEVVALPTVPELLRRTRAASAARKQAAAGA